MPRLQVCLSTLGRHEEDKPLAWLRPARATTQLAPASKEKQRRQGVPGRPNRACSAFTLMVKFVVVKTVSNHKVLQRQASGQ
ncbi:MAG TPA: hypothetical protein VIM63_00600, partial [Rhodoferax sp.]